MSFDSRNLSPAVRVSLEAAGWASHRRLDREALRGVLVRGGFDPPGLVLDFLEQFGGLRFNNPRSDPLGCRELFHLDFERGVLNWPADSLEDVPEVVGAPVCTIGELHDCHAGLVMDPRGRTFGVNDDQIFQVADSPDELFEKFFDKGGQFTRLAWRE